MKLLKLIIIFVALPLHVLAEDGNQTLSHQTFLSQLYSIIVHAWNHTLITLDNQPLKVSSVVIGIIFLALGLRIAKYCSKAFKTRLFKIIKLDKNSANLLSRAIDYFFMLIAIIIVLDIAGVPLNIFTFIGGAFVISIGLSSQHLLNNFISGLYLIMESRIRVGDVIEFEDVLGRVESVEARMVHLRTLANMDIFIPHSRLMQEKFISWTHKDARVRISVEFRIDHIYKNDDFEHFILNAVSQNRNILTTPKPQLLLLALEDNLLHYEVNFWINVNEVDRRKTISEINTQILNALEVHNIPLAIPSFKSNMVH